MGAIVTLGAAIIAWRAVQRQIDAQRDSILLDVTTREEDRLEADLHAIDVCLDLGFKAQPASANMMSSYYASELSNAGLSADELDVRGALFSRVLAGPVRPVILSDFGSVLSSMVVAAEAVSQLERLAGLGQYALPPSSEEIKKARHNRSIAEVRLARIVKKYQDRQALIVSDLAKFRTRIDAGLRALHD